MDLPSDAGRKKKTIQTLDGVTSELLKAFLLDAGINPVKKSSEELFSVRSELELQHSPSFIKLF